MKFQAIAVAALMLFCGSAFGQEKRFQIPATPYWVSLPAGWLAQAGKHSFTLNAQNGKGGKLTVSAPPRDKRDLAGMFATERRKLQAGYGKIQWAPLRKNAQVGRLGVANHAPLQFRIQVVEKDKQRIVSVAVAKTAVIDVVFAVQKKSMSMLVREWPNKKGNWQPVPFSGKNIDVPSGWRMLNVRGNTIHVITPDRTGAVQAEFVSAQRLTAEALMAPYVRSMSTDAGWEWTDAMPWRGRGRRGALRRSGKAQLQVNGQMVPHYMRLYALPLTGGVLIFVGTAKGSAALKHLSDIDKMASSMTSR